MHFPKTPLNYLHQNCGDENTPFHSRGVDSMNSDKASFDRSPSPQCLHHDCRNSVNADDNSSGENSPPQPYRFWAFDSVPSNKTIVRSTSPQYLHQTQRDLMSLGNGADGDKVVSVSDINTDLNNINIEDFDDQVRDIEDGTDVPADKEIDEENMSHDDLKNCTVLEPKEKLRKKKLPMTGNKNDLIKLILGLEEVVDSVGQTQPHEPTEHDLRKHNVTELKEMLQEKKM
jgi:hypothetical protein